MMARGQGPSNHQIQVEETLDSHILPTHTQKQQMKIMEEVEGD